MKKLLMIALVAAGCGEGTKNINMRSSGTPTTLYDMGSHYYVKVFKIDGCEYVSYGESIIHKGNCSNPIHHPDTLITTK